MKHNIQMVSGLNVDGQNNKKKIADTCAQRASHLYNYICKHIDNLLSDTW